MMLPTTNLITVNQHLNDLRREAHRWRMAGIAQEMVKHIERDRGHTERRDPQLDRQN